LTKRTAEATVPALAVRGLGVTLSRRRILDHVNFTVAAGEFVGVIGSNGAGKTTLLRVILGLQKPDSGTVTVVGANGKHRRGLIGYLPQKVNLDPDVPLRARDVIALGLDGGKLGARLYQSAHNTALVEEMIHDVGAEAFADSRIGELSGGQQQRVLLGHALISRPPLLLLDEPLASLDPASVHDIVDVLAKLSKQRNVAILLSAHDMNPLLAFMDRIVYLAEGNAVAGTTAEVVQPDVLSSLYGRKIEVVRAGERVFVVADDIAPADHA
jgi:zinc/manganese transport system ATP-binding protein